MNFFFLVTYDCVADRNNASLDTHFTGPISALTGGLSD